MARRLLFEKGVSDLIKAFAKAKALVPDPQLMLAGQGDEKSNLQALVAVNSALAQTIEDFEVIVVDDAFPEPVN